ncbi:MAG: hypothetical protein H0Z40_04025 [Desulfotomaculum sp.]|nr:hypothetical protein [Desulfotomaculum sp.]
MVMVDSMKSFIPVWAHPGIKLDETIAAKEARKGVFCRGKLLGCLVVSRACRGLQCGLSGNLAPVTVTAGKDLKGKPPVWRQLVVFWENLLDLSRNIYPASYHRHTLHRSIGVGCCLAAHTHILMRW